jgi:hypothetical protein
LIIEERLVDDLLDYLAKRPWFEVDKLIRRVAELKNKKIETPQTIEEGSHGGK